jgi:phospholipase/carboxylesterase
MASVPALHDPTRVLVAGPPLAGARGVTILLHGRGGSADDIATLASVLASDGLTFLVPEATGHTWYPQRFLAPLAANEPWLTSALGVVGTLVAQATAAGIPTARIAVAGFSQGACLALEFVARAPARYGAAIAFSGGLIGPPDEPRPPVAAGATLGGTPVFLGCGDLDAHIPAASVEASAAFLRGLGGEVDMRLYPGMGHTINQDEIAAARTLLTGLAARAV